jgi:hypothetical protein
MTRYALVRQPAGALTVERIEYLEAALRTERRGRRTGYQWR